MNIGLPGSRSVITAALLAAASLILTAENAMSQPQPIEWKQAGVVAIGQGEFSPAAKLAAVPIHAVTMGDGFWKPRMEANRKVAIPRLLKLLEENGVVDNFRRLSWRKQCDRRGLLFTDSDLYKWMEAAAFVLQTTEDKELAASLDRIIDEVVATQGDDGYINTWFVDDRANKRWTRLESDHELYCAGHLFQAGIAHYRATGSRKLLDPCIKFADYICATFGEGRKVQGYPGHPELEMALVELYRTTGDKKYLDLCRYYLVANKYLERSEVHGHAVRMMYLNCGGADYYAETGEKPFLDATLKMWNDMVGGKLYVTGGVGATRHQEAFGDPFELPNRTAYAETCAGIGNMFFQYRMTAITGEARFADMFERVLYNGFLSGVSLGGDEYFYVNPLANDGHHRRRPWYGCTCCPPNVERMIASLPGYMFSTAKNGLYVHLYDDCTLDWKLEDGTPIRLTMTTDYPWKETVRIRVDSELPEGFDLAVRLPAWCRDPQITLNGSPRPSVSYDDRMASRDYLHTILNTKWKAGTELELTFPMPVEAVVADPRVESTRNSAVLFRGPVAYCLEGEDNETVELDNVRLLIDARTRRPQMDPVYKPDLLGGVTVLEGRAAEAAPPPAGLYVPLSATADDQPRGVRVTAIPYYAWANRGQSPMRLWLNYALH